MSTLLIKKHEIEEYMKKVNNNVKVRNNMILFRIKN